MTFVSGALLPSATSKTLFHEVDDDSYTPGVYAIILSRTVPVGQTWYMEQAELSAPVSGLVRIKKGSDVLAIGHLNPAQSVYQLKVPNPIPIFTGDVITVEFCARVNAPASSAYSFIHGFKK